MARPPPATRSPRPPEHCPKSGRTELELTWIGKDVRPRLEPRVLVEEPEKSYHATKRVTDHDIFDNRLIFGDNLLALKALVDLACTRVYLLARKS